MVAFGERLLACMDALVCLPAPIRSAAHRARNSISASFDGSGARRGREVEDMLLTVLSNGADDSRPGPRAVPSTSHLEVVRRDDLARLSRWQTAFANERKDHRYYELVEDTLHPEFDYRYFVIR